EGTPANGSLMTQRPMPPRGCEAPQITIADQGTVVGPQSATGDEMGSEYAPNREAGGNGDMTVHVQIDDFLAAQSERKRADVQTLHAMMLKLMPNSRLWFLDGKDEHGRTVSNPNIGYGSLVMAYADGRTREFYQVGLSTNSTGISVYIMGLEDKKYLANSYGATIGKASVTGYCIKFRALRDIDLAVLEAAIRDGIARTSA